MPDIFGAIKDVGSAVAGAAGDALSAVTPAAIKDKLFGTTQAPPTPTTPEATQSLIDNYIGHQPNDDQILKNIQMLGGTSSGVPVMDALANAGMQGMPYDPHTAAAAATGSNVQAPDPLTLANPQLQKYFKDEPRAQDIYVRNYMATDPNVISWAVQKNTKQVPGLIGSAIGKFSDIAGRPIGGTLDMLAKPAAYVETWYGTHFIFNDIADASLRQVMARHSYEYGSNFGFDAHYTQLRAAQSEAHHIEDDLKLQGPAAAAEYEKWLKDAGKPGLGAMMNEMTSQMVLDPLWLAPVGIMGDATKAAMKGVTGTEDVGKLFRLANAPALLGDFTMRDLLTIPETQYRSAVISHPSSLGPLRWLNERLPMRLGDAAHDFTLRYLSGPLDRAVVMSPDGTVDAGKTIDAKLNVLAHYSESIRTGKVSDNAAALFGTDMMEDPAGASLSVHTSQSMPKLAAQTQGMHAMDVAGGVMEALDKNPELAQLAGTNPEVLDKLLLDHVAGNARSIAADGQSMLFPPWYRKVVLRTGALQKQVMSYFSIDRPELLFAVAGGNKLTYYWTLAGQSTEATDIFAHSLGAILRGGDAELPTEFSRVAGALGMEPAAAYQLASSQTYAREAAAGSARAFDRASRLDNISSVDDAVAKATSAVTQPVKDLAPSGISRYLKWPLTYASRDDQATRMGAWWASAQEQLNLGTSPGRLINGLFPDMRGALTDAGVSQTEAERLEGVMLDHVRGWIGEGHSIADGAGLSALWHDTVNGLRAGDPSKQVSAYDYLVRHLRGQGYPEDAIPHLARDYEPTMRRVVKDIFSKIDTVPMEQTQAQFEQLKHEIWTMDQAMAHATHGDPILRPTTTYSAGLARAYGHDITQMDEVWRGDLRDMTLHVDRYLNTVIPQWEGADAVRKTVVGAADEMVRGRLNRLSQIAKDSLAQLADPAHEWDRDKAWAEYWTFTKDSMRDFADKAKAAVGAVNEGAAGPIDQWYAAEEAARGKHMAITARAMRQNTEAGWDSAATQVANVFKQMANERPAIFGVGVNDPIKAIGNLRPTAPMVRQIEEYLTLIQDHLGPDIAKARGLGGEAEAAAAPMLKNPYDVLDDMAPEVAKRGPTVAQRMIGNAMFKTDLVRMNYDKQYGWDGLLQMFSPYEAFATRNAMNALIRTAKQPGATAMLSKAILLPQQYAADYGHNVAPGSIPIPIPGLSSFLSNLPVIGDKIKAGKFGDIYWVDPMDMMFPMTRFMSDYTTEAKTATPAGQIADWMQSNTPLGLSPFAKIIGGTTGILPRDAWTNDLFSGGPFGVPMSVWGKIATDWLHTGNSAGMPPKEMANYTTHGVFSWQFLGQILGINDKTSLDQYRIEKALAANVADGTTNVDDAWQALKTNQGPAWDQAAKVADSAKFLQDMTGWLGFRATGTSHGDDILLGQKALYSKAAADGDLTTFFAKYPGYSVSRAVSKGLSDPVAQQQMIDTQMYFADIDKLVKQPYQRSLDDLNSRIARIRSQDVITQTDEQQITFYNKEIGSIKDQQAGIQKMIDNVYPNAQKDPSLFTMPQERAVIMAASRWYDIKQGVGDGIPATEAYADFQARQQRFLNSFPAHTDQTDTTWQSLGQDFMLTTTQYNMSINLAAQSGDWAKVDKLVNDRNDALTNIHAAGAKVVSRQDVEQYLSQVSHQKTPGELDFDSAKALYDYWMSAVSTQSPLSASQKSAVSAYFRSQPLMQKYYNAATIDLYNLDGAGKEAVMRRDILLKQYNALSSNDAQIDFMKQHEQEMNYANQVLGLPPMDIIDFRPQPPDVAALDPYLAQQEFSGNKNLADYLYGGATAPTRGMVQQATANSPAGSALPQVDIQALIDAAANGDTGSGY
jgi:hypothetical protein